MMLQPLGERSILQAVIQNVQELVAPDDIYVVVGYREQDVRAHLGAGFHYVTQTEPLGTGHAVLQVAPLLSGFEGNLLILYGDTPLFRPASIRGLLNRHHLKQAHLTLLTAVLDHPFPTAGSSATPAARSSTSSKTPRRRLKCARFAS